MRLALFTLTIIVALTLAAPLIAPYDPMSTTSGPPIQSPDANNWLGTDLLGRDVLSRVLFGGRRTLVIAALATIIATTPGLVIGLIAGISSHSVDRVIMVIINSMLAIPSLVIALVILTLLGQGTEQLALATGVAQVAVFAQVTRSATIAMRSEEYLNASRALGASKLHTTLHHILPNILPTLNSYAGVIFSYSIINSAALSFLGLGGDPGVPDWGAILADGRMAFQIAPWVAIVPGLLIMITVMAVNTLADYLATINYQFSATQGQATLPKHIRRLIRTIQNGKNTGT
jgi:peptide/nickel transport system permease protein